MGCGTGGFAVAGAIFCAGRLAGVCSRPGPKGRLSRMAMRSILLPPGGGFPHPRIFFRRGPESPLPGVKNQMEEAFLAGKNVNL